MVKSKALIVLTSHSKMGTTDAKTGYWLSELTHPFDAMASQGIEVDIASIQGGTAPMDPNSNDLEDSVNKALMNDANFSLKLVNTIPLASIHPQEYHAIVFAGGHGTMWDFPGNKEIQHAASTIYENNGIVAAVCHGPAALVDIKLSNGEYLIANKKITSFTNEEEEAVGHTNTVPFSLEDKLSERGANFIASAPWSEHIEIDARVITGQNPQSAHKMGLAIAEHCLN